MGLCSDNISRKYKEVASVFPTVTVPKTSLIGWLSISQP